MASWHHGIEGRKGGDAFFSSHDAMMPRCLSYGSHTSRLSSLAGMKAMSPLTKTIR